MSSIGMFPDKPDAKIEITEGMIEAGGRVLFEDPFLNLGPTVAEDLVRSGLAAAFSELNAETEKAGR
jgi:hypothetical protein